MNHAKRFIRSAGCLLLIFTILLCSACSKTPSPPTSSDNTPTTPPTESTEPEQSSTAFDKPILRFAVTSDIHIREASDNHESYARLESFYKTVYAYSDAQSDYNKLDGIFFLGDVTNNGTEEQYSYFFNYVKENTRPETITRTVLGNHEFYDTGYYTNESFKDAPLRFLKYTGYESTDSHQVIGGYHFIFLSMDQYDKKMHTYFSSDKQKWLVSELRAASAEDPNKPIFVFQHEPPMNTVLGSSKSNSDSGLPVILGKFPQVIDFSGHSHRPISHPRSIWQNTFTAFNTGSLAYLSVPIPDHNKYANGGANAIGKEGSWETDNESAERNGGMYYIVEVDKNHSVRVLIYNIFTESLWGEPIIIDSLDPESFQYTNDRKNDAEIPVFADDTALTIQSVTDVTATISIPQATCKDIVQSYRVEIYEGSELNATHYVLACTYYGDATPAFVKANIDALTPNTAYTAKVYAVSSWALESDPLTLDFSTK